MKYTSLGLLVVLTAVLMGCTSSPPQTGEIQQDTLVQQDTAAQQGEGTQVVIENFAFKPSTIEVKQGDTIEWVNKDSAPHTVTFDNGMADENLPSGGTARVTFTEQKQFTYFCSFHPGMKGIVVVS